ncbi:MAG: glycosyltransferase family 2 protein [Candidatus Kapaibacterium sp.]
MKNIKDIKVSTIIPTYNRAHIIGRAISSALAQSHENQEILISDDGSTDSTEEVINSFNDDRIKFLKNEHAGLPSKMRNIAAEKASGQYLAFLDSDDEWISGKLELQLDKLQRTGLLASSTNANRVFLNENKTRDFLYWPYDRIKLSDLFYGNLIIIQSVVIDIKLFRKIGGFPEFKLNEDYALWMKTALYSDFALVKEKLVNYYDQPNTTIRGSKVNIFDARRIAHGHLREFLNNYTDIPLRSKMALRLWPLMSIPQYPGIFANIVKKIRNKT